MEPSPMLVKGNRESDRPYRKVDCDHYGECLNVALKCRWSDFSCSECNAYSRTRLLNRLRDLRIIGKNELKSETFLWISLPGNCYYI